MHQENESVSLALSAVRRWEHFDHAADMGVRGIGSTREGHTGQID